MKKTERRWMWKRALSMLLVYAMFFTSADMKVLAIEADAAMGTTVSDAGIETVSGEDIEMAVPDEESGVSDVVEENSAASLGIEQEEISIKAKNDIGSLFADEMQEVLQNEQEAMIEEYAISDIRVAGTMATVMFHAIEDCTVVVCIYEEGSQKPYAFGSAPAVSADGKAEVTIETGQMPNYFEMKAYLIETDSLRPLSKEFYSRLYTQEIQFVENLTVDDFKPEQVVNLDEDETTNFIAFEEGVIIVRETSDANTLIAYDDGNHTYSFKNADETLKGLKEGDIFVYQDSDKQIKIIQVEELKLVTNAPSDNMAAENSETRDSDGEESERQNPEEENSETLKTDEEDSEAQRPETEDGDTDNAHEEEGETDNVHEEEGETEVAVVDEEIQQPDKDETITDDQPVTADKAEGEDIENQETEDQDSDKTDNNDWENDSEESEGEDADIRETDVNGTEQLAAESAADQEIIAQIVAADRNTAELLDKYFTAVKIEESLSNDNIDEDFLKEKKTKSFEDVELNYEGRDNNGETYEFDKWSLKAEIPDTKFNLEVSFAFKVDVKCYRYKPFSVEYASCSFMTDTRLSGSLSVEREISIPLLSGAPQVDSKLVEIEYIPKFVVGGKIELEVKGTQIKDTYRLIIGPAAPVEPGVYFDEPIRDPGTFDVKAETYVGVRWEPEIKLQVSDLEILDVGIKTGIELALIATSDIYNKDHPCNGQCTAYDVFFRVPFEITLHWCEKDVLAEWFPNAPLPEDGCIVNIPAFTAYNCEYHHDFGAGFGDKGRCPELKKVLKKVVVEVQDEKGIPLSGAEVTTNVIDVKGTTDNKGLTELEVPAGDWYFSAVYSNGGILSYGSAGVKVSDSNAKVLIRLGSVSALLPQDERVERIDQAGDFFTLITKTGSLYTWGDNTDGAVGNGSPVVQTEPVKVLDQVKEVAVDKYYCNSVAAVTPSGELYMWGSNSNGQLGIGDSDSNKKFRPTQVEIPNAGQDSWVKKVAIHEGAAAAVLENGDLYMWGYNYNGKLGTGDCVDRYTPCRIMGDVKDVRISNYITVVLTTDGKVYTWGDPAGRNMLGDGSTAVREKPDLGKPLLEDIKDIELSTYNGAAIQEDGSLYVWGWSNVVGSKGDLKKVKNLPPVKNVLLEYYRNYRNLGDDWILVQTEDDMLYAWGDNSVGQLGDTFGSDTNPRRVACVSGIKEVYTMVGEQVQNLASYAILTMALTKTGDLWAWGRGGFVPNGEPIKVASNVEKVSSCARDISSCFLIMKDGSIWTLNGTKTTLTEALQRFYWDKNNAVSASTYALEAVQNYAEYAADTGEGKTASYSGLLPNELYNFYVMKSESAETAMSNDNLLYISQGVSDGEGNLSFSYVMREEYQSPDVFIRSRSKANIADAIITIGTDGVLDYNGEEQYVKPIVIHDGKQLIEGKDYYLSGDFKAKEAGRYTVNIVGTGLYSGSKSVEYRISDGNDPGIDDPDDPTPDPVYGDVLPEDIPADGIIPEGLWIAGVSEAGYDYTGKAIKPEVRVYDYKTRLMEKTDYTIAYKNNTKAYGYASNDPAFKANNAPTITVTGKSNYTGKETQTFRILPLDISVGADASGGTDTEASAQPGSDVFAADNMTIAANKKNQKPVPALMWNDKKLKVNTDYSVTYYDSTGAKKLDYVKEAGNYHIELTGKGNFTGTRRVNLTVTGQSDQLKLMSKMTVAKIPNQPYTGSVIEPVLTVKDGKTTLNKNEHYTVSYSRNTEIGTAYAIVTGIEAKGYSGTKRVSFRITGGSVSRAAVTGLAGQTFIYGGVNKEPELTVAVKAAGVEKTLEKGADYKVTWQKNRDAGTATAIITGVGGYTGTLKKTFKIQAFDIAANIGGRFTAVLTQDEVPYAKGGTKPEVAVTFLRDNGTVQKLREGKDYTLSYKNHTTLNDGSRADKLPTVTIKGKGNFKGTYGTKLTYKIKTQDLGSLALAAADKTYQNKKNIFAAKVTITDLNGKVLKAGTDYDKTFAYAYKNQTTLDNGTIRAAGAAVDKSDIIPAGTVLEVTVSAKGNYTGTKTGEYRIAQASISSASVSIPKQTYTGQAITPGKDQITVRIKGKPVDAGQYEIVPGSYKNNVRKGTASVTIRGVDNYGGTKTVKFTIRAKGFLWWWRKG